MQALCFGLPGVDDTTLAVDPLKPSETERSRALASAIVAILDVCRQENGGDSPIVVVTAAPKPYFHVRIYRLLFLFY